MTVRAHEVLQIHLFLDNRPGILADLCAHLSDRGIDVRAMTASGGAETGEVRIVVDAPDAALAALTTDGIRHATTSCLAIEMPNRPGGLAEVARALSLVGVNIDSIYGSATGESGTALLILDVSDLPTALAIEWPRS